MSCCKDNVIIFPKGGVRGPQGPIGESGVAGTTGSAGVAGTVGGIAPTQPLKFVKELYHLNGTFTLSVLASELTTAGLLKSHFDGSPSTAEGFKIRIWYTTTAMNFYRLVRLNSLSAMSLSGIDISPSGDIDVNIINTNSFSATYRIVIIG